MLELWHSHSPTRHSHMDCHVPIVCYSNPVMASDFQVNLDQTQLGLLSCILIIRCKAPGPPPPDGRMQLTGPTPVVLEGIDKTSKPAAAVAAEACPGKLPYESIQMACRQPLISSHKSCKHLCAPTVMWCKDKVGEAVLWSASRGGVGERCELAFGATGGSGCLLCAGDLLNTRMREGLAQRFHVPSITSPG